MATGLQCTLYMAHKFKVMTIRLVLHVAAMHFIMLHLTVVHCV